MINFTWQEASDTSDSLLTSFKKTTSSDGVEQEEKGESLIIESNNEEV